MTIRDATEADLGAILAIYNEVIAHSTAIYTEQPSTLDDRLTWLRGRQQQGYPILVSEEQGQVVGFSSFGDFRAWPCYGHSVEHSVHVRSDCRGQGHGRALLLALLPRAEALGKHVMIAGVDAANEPSLTLHRSMGFEQVAHFRQVGWKFDRWLDLVFLQRFVKA